MQLVFPISLRVRGGRRVVHAEVLTRRFRPFDPGAFRARTAGSMIRLALFGGFTLSGEDGAAVVIASRKCRALLAFLALQPRPVPRERLAGLLWGDGPEARARGSLRQALTTLRHELPGDGAWLLATAEAMAIEHHALAGGCADGRRAAACRTDRPGAGAQRGRRADGGHERGRAGVRRVARGGAAALARAGDHRAAGAGRAGAGGGAASGAAGAGAAPAEARTLERGGAPGGDDGAGAAGAPQRGAPAVSAGARGAERGAGGRARSRDRAAGGADPGGPRTPPRPRPPCRWPLRRWRPALPSRRGPPTPPSQSGARWSCGSWRDCCRAAGPAGAGTSSWCAARRGWARPPCSSRRSPRRARRGSPPTWSRSAPTAAAATWRWCAACSRRSTRGARTWSRTGSPSTSSAACPSAPARARWRRRWIRRRGRRPTPGRWRRWSLAPACTSRRCWRWRICTGPMPRPPAFCARSRG